MKRAPGFRGGQVFTVTVAVRGTYTRYGFDRWSDGEKAVRGVFHSIRIYKESSSRRFLLVYIGNHVSKTVLNLPSIPMRSGD